MDELRPGSPLVAGNVTLVPVERCAVQSGIGEAGFWLSGLKEPCGIVVCDATGVRAFDAEAAEIPVDDLIGKVPGLAALLPP